MHPLTVGHPIWVIITSGTRGFQYAAKGPHSLLKEGQVGGCPGSSNFQVGRFNLSLTSFLVSASIKSQSREKEAQRRSYGSGLCFRSSSCLRGVAPEFRFTNSLILVAVVLITKDANDQRSKKIFSTGTSLMGSRRNNSDLPEDIDSKTGCTRKICESPNCGGKLCTTLGTETIGELSPAPVMTGSFPLASTPKES